MTGLNPIELLPALQASGAAGVVLALLIGAGHFVNAWKGGKASERKEQDMEKRLSSLEKRLARTERMVTALKDLVHTYRFQRDDARLYSRDLERQLKIPPREWEPDPKWPDDEDEEEEPS